MSDSKETKATPHENAWLRSTADVLVGREIVSVRYLTEQERADLGFYLRCIVLVLDDGTLVYPSRDDEGNDAGALFTTHRSLPTIPTI